jgi:beta-galactosidase
MKTHLSKFIFSLLFPLFLSLSLSVSAQSTLKRSNLLDFNWRFHKGGALGAEDPSFDDSKWRIINLPHDWSIEDLPGTSSPFNSYAISQVNGGFTTGGTGWYRKYFTIPDEMKDNRFIIMFEGVYMNADIWLNGELLGSHPYGYTSFWFDISGKVKTGSNNVLAVKVRNEGENSRWYPGSGIYRHVTLMMVPRVHVGVWGTYITTTRASDAEALINIRTSIVNNGEEASKIRLVTKVFNSAKLPVAEAEAEKVIDAGKTIEIIQEFKISNPSLWSPESPALYSSSSEIYGSDILTDHTNSEFGIRSISFDAVNGFLLNGKPLKMKGGCVHNDNGILGSKAFDRAEERRVELLKSSGFNAIRSAHNPPSIAFLNACDRLGMLVIDEAFDMWNLGKNPDDYHLYFTAWWKRDIESMILRDRNHPSVILWSIGNEIPDRLNPEVIELAKSLGNYTRALDPSRPVTSAVNNLSPAMDPFFAALDVAGYNYARGADPSQTGIYESDHKRMPQRVIVGTESFPPEAFGSWKDVIDHPYVTGDFVWTAFDYIGEASIGWRGYFQKQDFFPWNLAYCGDLDICGWKRAQSFYRDALWKKNQLSIWVTPPQPSFPLNPRKESWSEWNWPDVSDDWNWQGSEGKIMDVNIYSSCGEVELFLNGKSLGKKITGLLSEYKALWKVPFEPGTLKAVGFDGKKQVAISELHTAGEAVQIRLSADRNRIKPDGQDLSYVTVELIDKDGIRNPKSENEISFVIEGPGSIAGVGNANPVSLESYQLPQRKAWHGRCMVVIKADTSAGKIFLNANSAGLKSARLEIESN